MDEVLFEITETGVGIITLNRPEAINSLNLAMLTATKNKLINWESNPKVKLVIFKGAGAKGFCAGGDVKALYDAKDNDEKINQAETFFKEEYDTDQIVYHFPKPIIACLNGIVMGGGIGITYGASHRIVTEKTKWAMPEMNIGLFPDVGASYFLNKAPGEIGKYLGLTASVIRAADIHYMNAADIYMESDQITPFLRDVKQTDWYRESIHKLDLITKQYESSLNESSYLRFIQRKIDHHFSQSTIEKILASLDEDPSTFALDTKKVIQSKSPVSLKVTLSHLLLCERKPLEACFETDLILAKNFLRHNDFYEGVRSVLIDKDHNPHYQYKTLDDVSDAFVQSFFHS